MQATSTQKSETSNSRYFRVLQQPRDIFYKDEGGKGNYLTCIFKLCFGSNYCGDRQLTKPLRVEPSLYYESGHRVEDHDQSILQLIGHNEFKGQLEPMYIDSMSMQVVVRFRLTKVSRRKDNQRFKLCLSAVSDSVNGCSDVIPAFSTATQVLSKRKKQSFDNPVEAKLNDSSPRTKRARGMEQQLTKMNDTMLLLVSLVKSQNQRIASLETQLQHVRRPSLTRARVTLCPKSAGRLERRNSLDAYFASDSVPTILNQLSANTDSKGDAYLPAFLTNNSAASCGKQGLSRGISDLIVEEFSTAAVTSGTMHQPQHKRQRQAVLVNMT